MPWKHSIPNVLTAFRLGVAPLAFVLLSLLDDSPQRNQVVLGVIVAAVLSDFFDGKLARRYQITSNFGTIMDPVADTAFTMSVVLGLCAAPRFDMPEAVPLILFYRELVIQLIRRHVALKQVVLPALLSGKIKSYVQAFALVGLFLAVVLQDVGAVRPFDVARLTFIIGGIMVVANLLSLVQYVFAAARSGEAR